VALIIRICSSALALFLAVGSAQARLEPSPLIDYARGRLSDETGAAIANYAAALNADPANVTIATRAYREAMIAGDYRLALRAAQVLERAGAASGDARLLLYIDALRSRDRFEAARRLRDVARDPALAFIAPVLAQWLRFGGSDDLNLESTKDTGGPNAYAPENAALVALAQGDMRAGVDAVRTLWSLDPGRAESLRIVAAATLAQQKQYEAALSLLVADTDSTKAARTLIKRRKTINSAVTDPLSGTGFVLSRIADDLAAENAGFAAITLARLAQFADPQNARLALGAANNLLGAKRPAAALAAVDRLLADPLYGRDAQSLRIEILEALNRPKDAMVAAEAWAGDSLNETARMGDMALRRGDYPDAARRFDTAIAKAAKNAPWKLWHAAGNAHFMAGDWDAGHAAMETAYKLAPDEPLVLNSLGFGLVDRGVDLDRGKALIERAAAISPGNASIIDSQGWAAYRMGDFTRAIAALERAQSLEPTQAEISEHLGDAYWAAGRRIDARYAWGAARVQGDVAAYARLDAKIDRGLP